jgi:hypothetical protein
MKRIAVFVLLAALNVAWSMPGAAQSKRVVKYGHQSQKAAEKAAEKQQKENEKATRRQLKRIAKYEKKQRRAANKGAMHSTKKVSYRSRAGSR